MNIPSYSVSLHTARVMALHAQGLTTPNGAEPTPTPDTIYAAVERVGCVQIDTLHMVRRAHYLTLWSRLGSYDVDDFDRLIADPDQQRLCEDWWHAASIILLRDYRYTQVHKAFFHEGGKDWERGYWLSKPENRALMFGVLERIRREGPLRAADFEGDGVKRGSWWDWKSAKTALEYLWARGDLMVAGRVNFNKVYDLTERVMPAWVDRTPPTVEEVRRFRIEQGARSLGICQPMQVADYTYLKRGEVKPLIEELMAEGVLVGVQAELHSGKTGGMIVHRDNLPLLAQAADGAIQAGRTTFLNPFDSLWWARGRDEQLWGFRNPLEAYKPQPQRKWGYFCLSLLHRDRFVGRFDPKLERKEGLLRLKALYLEPGVEPDEELVADVAAAMRDFMAFHAAKELVIERSEPGEFGERLLGKL